MEKPEGELIKMVFNYYYGSEADQFNFIRMPKRLITDTLFADLSLSAKLLYGILLDRIDLIVVLEDLICQYTAKIN